ncbi:MAG TPA: TIGR02221 family CRISPR-associated protein [Candidatus Limnocylindrales bacterium]|nr:TIGR02221 family CRISPR-associated protein [Candidatus Limnocylindrales bacterium]
MSQVMLAFLGTNDYLPCNYLLNEKGKISGVRFIQEALVSLFCKDWTEKDRIIIFLTEEAKNKNWVDNGHKDRDGKPLQREGLKRRLESLGLKTKILDKEIPDGRTEEEIWRIFDEVLNQIDHGDEVIFDMTHAFRSLPMLAIIILNYAKVIKNIKINGVYYGAFESLGSIREVEKMAVQDRNVPIFNLTPFVRLFDWTNAIHNFITYGDAKDISELTQQEIKSILADTQGKDEGAQNLRELSKQLKKLTKLIQTSRGPGLIDGFDFDGLRELIKKEGFLKPINPLLDKIANKIKDFKNKDIKNGYAAVEWCIQHNLIPQGYTLLQETMISEVVVRHFGQSEILNEDKRKLAAQALHIANRNIIANRKIPEEEWEEPAKSRKEDVQKIISCLSEDFIKIYDSITQDRNDINHAGFRTQPSQPEDLQERLKERYYKNLKKGLA